MKSMCISLPGTGARFSCRSSFSPLSNPPVSRGLASSYKNIAGKGGLGFAVYQPAVEGHPQLFKCVLVGVGVGHEPTQPVIPLQICTRGGELVGSRAILRTKHTYA